MKTLLRLFLFVVLTTTSVSAQQHRYDVVVYGGTAGGIVAAIAASREGASVALVEPGQHLGGMVSGGLSDTDLAEIRVIGGIAKEFFELVGKHYGEPLAWKLEPHVAEQVFESMVKDAGVKLFHSQRVDTVQKNNSTIKSFKTLSGAQFFAKSFVDASYEGDLMARAGVSYTVGREGAKKYGEKLAGFRYDPWREEYGETAINQVKDDIADRFRVPVPALDKEGNLASGVIEHPNAELGDGDKKVMAYNFRVCLTKVEGNRVPITKPEGYERKQFQLLSNYLEVRPWTTVRQLLRFGFARNDKADINTQGPLSTDFIGANWDYPDADYDERDRIWKEHEDYTKGFLYFLSTDPVVPPLIRQSLASWGYCKDEFVDNDHFPHQLYVREARRMLGRYVLTEHDVWKNYKKEDSVGMGAFAFESHHVQRFRTEADVVVNEGIVYIKIPQAYAVPYRSITPKMEEANNLLVPVCVSASHIAYSSLRMEPQYMILGHSAGVAAAMAAKQQKAVQSLDVAALQKRLVAQTQVLR